MLANFLECGWIPADASQVGDNFRVNWMSANAQDEKLQNISVEIDNKAGRISLLFRTHAKIELMVNNHRALEDEFAKAWPALPRRVHEKLDPDVFSKLLGHLIGLASDAIDIAKPTAN